MLKDTVFQCSAFNDTHYQFILWFSSTKNHLHTWMCLFSIITRWKLSFFLFFLFFLNLNENSITFLHQTLYLNFGPENISFFLVTLNVPFSFIVLIHNLKSTKSLNLFKISFLTLLSSVAPFFGNLISLRPWAWADQERNALVRYVGTWDQSFAAKLQRLRLDIPVPPGTK